MWNYTPEMAELMNELYERAREEMLREHRKVKLKPKDKRKDNVD